MYLTELNRNFSELDRKAVLYIKQIKNQMMIQAREQALLTCKYKLGTKFNHAKYGLCIIKDLEINLNKKEFMSFDNDITILDKDYYNPYYMYLVTSLDDLSIYNLRLTQIDIDRIFV